MRVGDLEQNISQLLPDDNKAVIYRRRFWRLLGKKEVSVDISKKTGILKKIKLFIGTGRWFNQNYIHRQKLTNMVSAFKMYKETLDEAKPEELENGILLKEEALDKERITAVDRLRLLVESLDDQWQINAINKSVKNEFKRDIGELKKEFQSPTGFYKDVSFVHSLLDDSFEKETECHEFIELKKIDVMSEILYRLEDILGEREFIKSLDERMKPLNDLRLAILELQRDRIHDNILDPDKLVRSKEIEESLVSSLRKLDDEKILGDISEHINLFLNTLAENDDYKDFVSAIRETFNVFSELKEEDVVVVGEKLGVLRKSFRKVLLEFEELRSVRGTISSEIATENRRFLDCKNRSKEILRMAMIRSVDLVGADQRVIVEQIIKGLDEGGDVERHILELENLLVRWSSEGYKGLLEIVRSYKAFMYTGEEFVRLKKEATITIDDKRRVLEQLRKKIDFLNERNQAMQTETDRVKDLFVEELRSNIQRVKDAVPTSRIFQRDIIGFITKMEEWCGWESEETLKLLADIKYKISKGRKYEDLLRSIEETSSLGIRLRAGFERIKELQRTRRELGIVMSREEINRDKKLAVDDSYNSFRECYDETKAFFDENMSARENVQLASDVVIRRVGSFARRFFPRFF